MSAAMAAYTRSPGPRDLLSADTISLAALRVPADFSVACTAMARCRFSRIGACNAPSLSRVAGGRRAWRTHNGNPHADRCAPTGRQALAAVLKGNRVEEFDFTPLNTSRSKAISTLHK